MHKKTYNNIKLTQKTKAKFSRLLPHPRGPSAAVEFLANTALVRIFRPRFCEILYSVLEVTFRPFTTL